MSTDARFFCPPARPSLYLPLVSKNAVILRGAANNINTIRRSNNNSCSNNSNSGDNNHLNERLLTATGVTSKRFDHFTTRNYDYGYDVVCGVLLHDRQRRQQIRSGIYLKISFGGDYRCFRAKMKNVFIIIEIWKIQLYSIIYYSICLEFWRRATSSIHCRIFGIKK